MFSDKFVAERPPGKLEISMVLAGAFGAIGRRWPALVIVTLALYVLPYFVTSTMFKAQAAATSSLPDLAAAVGHSFLLAAPLILLFQPMFAALCAWIVWADAAKTDANLPAALLRVGPQIVWIVLLNLSVELLIVLGLILFVVPGVMALIALWAAIPACVVERLSPVKAISRSLELTRGKRWRLLGLLVIVVAFQRVLGILVSLVVMMMGLNFAGHPGLAVAAFRSVVSGLGGLLEAACVGSAYVELRGLREGVAVGDAAAVFA